MAIYFRRRSALHLPITLSVSLMTLNVTLMVCWIVLLAKQAEWTALTVGVVTFTMILIGLSFWLVLTIKEIRLNHRQANFVDSVTHELKSPIAALQLSLETLKMRDLDEAKRTEFHVMMADELTRLDQLIDQLLEVGRLDAIGAQEGPETVPLQTLLYRCTESACIRHKVDIERVLTFDVPQISIHARRMMLQLVFSNLIDNAVKYSDEPPAVHIQAIPTVGDRVTILITDNGSGVSYDERKKVFKIFYRGGSELERRRKGTGLGLYIVYTIVRRLKGKVTVFDRVDGEQGCTFQVELPGRVEQPETPSETDPTSDVSTREEDAA